MKKICRAVSLVIIAFFIFGCESSNLSNYKYKSKNENTTCIEHNENMECTKRAVVLKYEIEESLTKKLTINQNYHIIEEYIKDKDFVDIDEIQYLATGKLSNGYDGKIVSFTIKKDIIMMIKNGSIYPVEYEKHLDDIWIYDGLKT